MRKLFHAMAVVMLAIILAGVGVSARTIAAAAEESADTQTGALGEESVEAAPTDQDAVAPEGQESDAAPDQETPDAVTEEAPVTEDEPQAEALPGESEEEGEPALDVQSSDEALVAAGDTVFVDVSLDTGHHDAIIWLADVGISEGWLMGDGTREFRPYSNVLRCDMAAFLFRLAKRWGLVTDGWQPHGTASFSDVDEGTPHYREVMWLAETGISTGWANDDGTFSFRPFSHIIRADMAAFLARLYALGGGQPTGSKDFSDVHDDTPHVVEVRWLAASGISKGWDVGEELPEFRPWNKIVRADMAAFLQRLDTLWQTTAQPYTIRFIGNGGKGTMADLTAFPGQSVNLSRNRFTRTDYQFMAWNTKSNGSGTYYVDEQEVTDLTNPGGRISLCAQWVGSNYTIKYDANGGVGTMDDQLARRGVSTKLNKVAFTHEWAYFTGWNTKSDGSGVAIEPSGYVTNPAPYIEGETLGFGGEVTLYAQWQNVSNWYRIDIWPNGGTRLKEFPIGHGDWKWLNLNTWDTIEPNIYEREGYVFAGWNTKADGTGVPYEEEELVYNLKGDFGLFDLHAQWVQFDEEAFKGQLVNAYNDWRRENGLGTANNNATCTAMANESAAGCAQQGSLSNELGVTLELAGNNVFEYVRYHDIVATSKKMLTAEEVIQLWASNQKDLGRLRCQTATRVGAGVYVDRVHGVYWYALVYYHQMGNISN